jgi:hypothetical protein
MQSGQKKKGKGVFLRGFIFLAIALVLTYLVVAVPLSAASSKGGNSHGDNSHGDNSYGDNSHRDNSCTDKCGRPYPQSSTKTEYETVKVCFPVTNCVQKKDCDPVTSCTGNGKHKVCTTKTVCTTKKVCTTNTVCTNVKLKRDCTTTITYQDCTAMTKCDHTGCGEAGTYTKVISQTKTCTDWEVAC